MGDSDETVRVALRVRPLLPFENLQRCRSIVQYPLPNQVVIGDDRRFTYDEVFGETAPQNSIFDKCVSNLLDMFHNGYNATILAYGQTGSGKTFTMGTSSSDGVDKEKLGILPRFVSELFEMIEKNKETRTCQVKIGFIEIYNEDIHDLLNPDKNANSPQIREIEGQIVVQGATQEEVHCAKGALDCLEKGSLCRTTGSTLMNQTSSRSHAIFSVILDQVKVTDIGNGEVNEEQLSSKFNFVDLAGSERLKRTGAVGMRMKEGISINSGLLALGNVISALGDPTRKGGHVPYRDSKITRLLQDSLGGNSKTLMIACVSPADTNFEETLNTLKYANRAKNIKNKAVINRDPNAAKIEQMALRIQELEAALAAGGIAVDSLAEVFAPSEEEYTYLKEQNVVLEKEVKRLTSQLKQSRLDSGTISETLVEVEKQRDVFRLQLMKISEMYPDIKMDLNKRELDLIESNITLITDQKIQIQKLRLDVKASKDEVAALKRQISNGLRRGSAIGVAAAQNNKNGAAGSLKVSATMDDIVMDMNKNSKKEENAQLKMDDTLSGVGEVFSAMSMAPRSSYASLNGTGASDDAGTNEDEDDFEDDDVKSIHNVAAVKERQHEYNMKQMNEQHDDIVVDLAQNENLLHQLIKTKETALQMRQQYEEKLHDMEEELQRMANQQDAETVGLNDKEANKVKSKYEKQMSELKKQIAVLKSKLEENKRLHVLHDKDEARIKKLQAVIEKQKAEKIALSKKMKEAHDKHREWMKQKEKRVKTLEKQTRKNKSELMKLKVVMEKQEAVIRRKNEEKFALEKKIQNQKDVVASAKLMREQYKGMESQLKKAAVEKNKKKTSRERGREYVDDIDRLKGGFDDEIDRAVKYLDLMAEHEKLVQQKQQAVESKMQADMMMENKDDSLSPEVLEYWADRSEALKSQIGYLNKQIVTLRVKSSKCAESARDIRRNIFNRHRVRRMEHGRALIMHLMDQLVAMKHEKRERDQLVEDLKVTLENQKHDLKAVTRQSLLLQKTPSSKKLLAEMDEMMKVMEETKPALSSESKTTSQEFLLQLNVTAPEEESSSYAGHQNKDNRANNDAQEQKDEAYDNSHIFHRLFPSPSPKAKRIVTAWDELSPRSGAESPSFGASPVSPSSGQEMGDGSGYGSDDDHKRRKPQKNYGDGGEESEEEEEEETNRKGSVFDRLTNKKHFTGMHKKIHKEVSKVRLKKSSSEKNLRVPKEKGSDTKKPAPIPEHDSTSANSTPSTTVPMQRSSSARRARPQGNVFSRLTDESSFTGMHKARVEESKKSKAKNKPLRSMSEMEKQFEELNAEWDKDHTAKEEKKQKHHRNHSSGAALSPTHHGNRSHNPVGQSPVKIDRDLAATAVKNLDFLFSKARSKKGAKANDKAKDVEDDDADGEEEGDSPLPTQEDVLDAVDVLTNS